MSGCIEQSATAITDHPTICTFPSCWEEGQPITADDEAEIEAILCKIHRKAFLGVST